MNKRLLLMSAFVSLLVVAGFVATASGADRMSTSTVPDYDLDVLGLELAPLDVVSRSAVDRGLTIDEVTARQAVAARLGREPGNAEVLHVMARIAPDERKEAVWLLLYKGASPEVEGLVPWGPVGDEFGEDGPLPASAIQYAGFLVRDTTGELVRMFVGGQQ